MRKRHYTEAETGIDFTGILDIAFIVMLMFFGASVYLVESTRDRTTEPLLIAASIGPPISVVIDATGLISIEGRPCERTLVVENLRRLNSERPDATLHIDVHPDAESDALVIVVDAARLLGIETVDVETGEES